MGSLSEMENDTVLDIGGSSMPTDLGERLIDTLKSKDKTPILPDEFLYSDEGLEFWKVIISQDEFYQTHDEIALFKENGEAISKLFARESKKLFLLDIGAGDTGKVSHLLGKLKTHAQVPITYCALDISKASLEANVTKLAKEHSGPGSTVNTIGLWGTFQQGQKFATEKVFDGRMIYLSLGSVLCNDEWDKAVEHLKGWKKVMRPDDLMLVGMDGHTAKNKDQRKKLWDSYHKREALLEPFFENGYEVMNRSIGGRIFNNKNFEYHAEIEDEPTTRHRNWIIARKDIWCEATNSMIKAGQEYDWFDAHRYGPEKVREMCSQVELEVVKVWQAKGSHFYQYLIRPIGAPVLKDSDSGVSGVA
ncbi:hypothetical protein J3458_000687 [Metarhizium acridum]|uniref:4-dimethylallyltryptophan N-methyltransferase n=1 Tax=Metarhizium acridum (strain CQMa 102) TaxID=655827 RepID=E9E0Q2_METAQ|nr:ergot alkaloid biosynthetic protein B [Metarhizium acridum CQMa 102]EFY90456.1 ergot alkaloid biosynthetic protein B [Metarhizium acridum CQMa 102]KAG8423833.1 hypothetical protein J3458_000687 [Metarhizium acridum]